MPESRKVALITGGARRLGAHFSRTLAAQGYQLAINYHTARREAERLREELERQGTQVLLIPGDITRSEVRAALVEQTIRQFGRIDLLVNNASILLPTTVEEISEELWLRIMGVNAQAPLFLSLMAYPHLRKTRGAIVNLVDTSAFAPWKRYLLHSISKGTLVHITRALALAFAPEVRVNAMAPGLVLPPENFSEAELRQALKRVPLGRPGTPDHAAQALLFLAENDYVTGVVLPVDAGRHLG